MRESPPPWPLLVGTTLNLKAEEVLVVTTRRKNGEGVLINFDDGCDEQ